MPPSVVRASRFNVYLAATVDTPDLIFNSLTRALAELSPKEAKLIRAIQRGDDQIAGRCFGEVGDEVINHLLHQGFLVTKGADELSGVLLRANLERFGSAILPLTILPTLRCNFSCPYCFETPQNSDMSADVEAAIVEYALGRQKRYKKLHVTWFGGEPLLRQDVVHRLSTRLRRVFPDYAATLITNGYLLDEEVSRDLRDCRVQSVQVTLDGPQPLHEKRRVHRDGVPTFDRVLQNIRYACAQGMRLSVRVNVDREGAADPIAMAAFLDLVRRRTEGRASVYFSRVFQYRSAARFSSDLILTNEEFCQFVEEVYREVLARGYAVPMPRLANASRGTCVASAPEGYTVAPDGTLFRCWEEPGSTDEVAAGHLLAPLEDQGTAAAHTHYYILGRDWESEECRSCSLLPVCMGSCNRLLVSQKRIGNKQTEICDQVRHWAPTVMRLRYAQSVAPTDPARSEA